MWFVIDDFDAKMKRVADNEATVLDGPLVNPNAGHREVWLRGPDNCYLAPRKHRAAATVFEEALVLLPESCDRRRATIQVGLARARLGTGDVEDARELACTALGTFVERGSLAGISRVHRVRNALQEAGQAAAVLALDEHARALREAAR